jgi:transaldolase
VIEAYLRGLERLAGVGGDPSPVHSVASFFVSRVDSETDRRLDELDREDLKGRLGIANARLAYQQYKHAFTGDRWERLAAHGATKQRCLWASTSTKDPTYRDTLYVDELVGWETISTMPEETMRAFQDHGRVEPRLESDIDDALCLLAALAGAGVDYDDVVAQLEREGIQKFVDSLSKIFTRLESKRVALRSPADEAVAGT